MSVAAKSWKVLLVLAIGQCVFLSSPARAADGGRRPNILVIMSDEHNASVLGCYGNKIVQTPNLDRLAGNGVRFDAAYTSSPLCVPCRLSFTAGKYISRVGVWNNNCELPGAEYPSIARIMNAAGYESYLCGKMHYAADRRYGFTEIGGNMNGSEKNGKGGRRDPDDLTLKNGVGESNRFKEFSTGDESSVMKHDRRVTAGTVELLSKRQAGDKPFFMIAGYLAPHFPLVVPEKYWKMYEGKVPMPVIPPGHLDALPLNYKHLRVGFQETDVPPETVRKGRELYYGFVSWVDNEIGKVLKALDAAGLADNTVVIYTTDHGENMGEHGMWWKSTMYDTASRVPLIVRWPGQFKGGQERIGACSLLDVVQTIADIGGAKVPADWNGTSMLPLLKDASAPWKDMAVTEYYAHHIASGYAMIRQGRYKYVYHTQADAEHPAERELYDLQADPGELKNLAKDDAQKERITAMHAALVKEVGEDPEVIEQRCRAEIAKGYDTDKAAKPKAKKKKAKAVLN